MALLLIGAVQLAAALSAPAAPGTDYVREVRPILARNCFACHGADEGSREADLRLDTSEGSAMDLGGYRPIVPGDSSDSEVYLRITDERDPMPPPESGHTLTATEIETIRRWIDGGAEYAPHWAFVRPQRPPPPDVSATGHGGSVRNGIDRFVLARLMEEGLSPSPAADRQTLARRASLDLTGLPPTLEEVRAFVADTGENAYEDYIDDLLASPAYGERWASVWLDQARYADSRGHGSDPLRVIWRFRDWVIDALNANMPFDRFTIEQLAGDLLPDPTLDQRLATAFHRNTMTNTEGGTDDEEFRVAAVKDRAITTGQVWLGMTFGCAQCHSHKFDPLSQEEFYSFYAFFNQTADTDKNDDSPRLETPGPTHAEDIATRRAEIATLEAQLNDPGRDISAGLAAWEAVERAHTSAWRTLEFTLLTSDGGAEFTTLEDGSILVGGPSPETDVYTLVAPSPLEKITALRLEVLPHETLSMNGPGREPGIGNVVLNDLRLEALPADPAAPTARYVRITNLGAGSILSLAEVEITSGGENVARAGTATQSSTAYDGPAALAIDGNTDGRYAEGASVTHTNTETDPWWEIDLGSELPLESIHLWNRTDGNLGTRLSGFVVQALDAQRRSTWSAGLRNPPLPDIELDLSAGAGEILLANASADLSDPDGTGTWLIERAIDTDLAPITGWGLNPSLGGVHVAVFETAGGALPRPKADPAGGESAGPADDPADRIPGGRLRLALHQGFGTHHTIGRFRISVTDRPRPVRALERSVAGALATPLAERTQQQSTVLVRHYQTIDPDLKTLRDRVSVLEGEIAALNAPTTPIMVELPADQRRETRILEKGNYLSPGAVVEAHAPAFLHAWGGGELSRLGLAGWLMRPENPLTPRVSVNRLWARLFGRGLVVTEEDFGTQGSLPSHPDLLDWLAVEYLESGWDTKWILKTIMTSATYRQASTLTPASLERDPRNTLLALARACAWRRRWCAT